MKQKQSSPRRKRRRERSSDKFIYFFGALFFFAILQFLLSTKILHNSTLNDPIHVNFNQRMVILAGPHKTGKLYIFCSTNVNIIQTHTYRTAFIHLFPSYYSTNIIQGSSSIQTNLWLWTQKSYSFTISEKYDSYHHEIFKDWVWPVPEEIGRLESVNKTWDWTPSKGFYPMMEVLLPPPKFKNKPKKLKKSPRPVFQKYSGNEILKLYHDRLEYYWNQKMNIVIGTEAVDNIVKFDNGVDMLKTFSKDIVPNHIDPRRITVVVAYRTPKVNHLISMWHQIMLDTKRKSTFFDWITLAENTLGPMDALGMVEMFLQYTEWNVVLLDLEGLKVNEWDASNLVACKVLQGNCVNRSLADLSKDGAMKTPVITNVRSHQKEPNVSQEALDEMETVLRLYDCNYQSMLERERNGHRLKIYYPVGLDETMKLCSSMNKSNHQRQPRSEMKSLLGDIALKHGRLDR